MMVCSSKGIVDVMHPKQGFLDMKGTGFDRVTLDFCDVFFKKEEKRSNSLQIEQKLLELSEELEEKMSVVIENGKHIGCSFSMAQIPYFGWLWKYPNLQGILLRLVKKCIRLCAKAECTYFVVPPVEGKFQEAWATNKDFYLKLAETAKECQVTLLLKNVCKNINGHYVRGLCCDEVETANWIDTLNEVAQQRYGKAEKGLYFGICVDVGVCNLCGQNMYEYINTLGGRIQSVILRDGDGNSDNTMLPFTCVNQGISQTDWLYLIRGLRKIEFKGQLMIDLADTSLACPPMLRPKLIQYAKEIAEYFLWQIDMERMLKKYDSRVLFGAGNMCRNYMKNYGCDYPPMFTCDNNSALWGQMFEGLEVKSPERLKELPGDVAIFICNIYYREIEEQLRSMGLKNPIEFFNDEFLPSFPFDRIDVNSR